MTWLKHKKIDSKEYLELKQELQSLKIDMKTLQLDLELIIKKLKFKYKISTRDNTEETETSKSNVLLPE